MMLLALMVNTFLEFKELKKSGVDRAAFYANTKHLHKENRLKLYKQVGHIVRNHTHSHVNIKDVTTKDYLLDFELAHELGHSIFIEYLALNFKELNNSVDDIKSYNQLGNKVRELFSQNKLEKVRALNLIFEEKEVEVFRAKTVLSPIMLILFMSELFSDLVSVLYAEDLQAFSKAAAGQNPTKEQIADNLVRDFSQNISTANWNNNESHDLYSPVRCSLGEKLKFPMSANEKRIILSLVLRVMTKELILTYQSNETKSIMELKNRLIDLLM